MDAPAAASGSSRVGNLSSKPPPLSSSSSSSATAATATKSVAEKKKDLLIEEKKDLLIEELDRSLKLKEAAGNLSSKLGKKKGHLIDDKGIEGAAKAPPRPRKNRRVISTSVCRKRKSPWHLSSKPKKKPKRSVLSSATATATATAVAASSKKKDPPLLSDTVVLPPERLEQCRLWAKEGIVNWIPHYDYEKHWREVRDKAVAEGVQMVNDCERRWIDATFYGLGVLPPKPKEIPSDDEYVFKREFEPEELPPKPPSSSKPVESLAGPLVLKPDRTYFDDPYFAEHYELKPEEDYEAYVYSGDGSEDFDGDETTLSQIEPGPFPSSDSCSSQSPHGKQSLSLNSVGSLMGDIKEDKRE